MDTAIPSSSMDIVNAMIKNGDVFDPVRHKQLFEELKSKLQELPKEIRQLISEDTLSDLAASLLDRTVLKILMELRLQQKQREIEMLKKRDSLMNKLENKRVKLVKEIEDQFMNYQITSDERIEKLKVLKKHYLDKIVSIDLELLKQVDKNVIEQQKVLMDAQVPGFKVTSKSKAIKLQVKLLEFISQIDGLLDESKLNN